MPSAHLQDCPLDPQAQQVQTPQNHTDTDPYFQVRKMSLRWEPQKTKVLHSLWTHSEHTENAEN